MAKPTEWKVHLAFDYPYELLNADHIARLQKRELCMYQLSLSRLGADNQEMLAILRVPAGNQKAAAIIGRHEMHNALLRLNLPGITTFDVHVQPILSILST